MVSPEPPSPTPTRPESVSTRTTLVLWLNNGWRVFFFTDAATTEFYTLSLHDVLPISRLLRRIAMAMYGAHTNGSTSPTRNSKRSEEHTSELQSRGQLVCRLLLEK